MTVPETAARYFGPGQPLISGVFTPLHGWQDAYPLAEVSHAALTVLARKGITAVALTGGGRTADFTVAELIGSMRSAAEAAAADGGPEPEVLEELIVTMTLFGVITSRHHMQVRRADLGGWVRASCLTHCTDHPMRGPARLAEAAADGAADCSRYHPSQRTHTRGRPS
jgi:hypothetical protein